MQKDTNKAKQAPGSISASLIGAALFWAIWVLVLGVLLLYLYDFHDACTNPEFPIPAEIGWGYSSIEAYAATSAINVIILGGILTLGALLKRSRWIFIILMAFFFAAPQLSTDPYKSPFWEYPLGKLLLPLIPELGGTLCLTRQ